MNWIRFKPYYTVFQISGPLDPAMEYTYFDWYPRGSKITFKKCVAVVKLNRFVAQGAFNEAGRYAFVLRKDGRMLRYDLFKLKRGEDNEPILEATGAPRGSV